MCWYILFNGEAVTQKITSETDGYLNGKDHWQSFLPFLFVLVSSGCFIFFPFFLREWCSQLPLPTSLKQEVEESLTLMACERENWSMIGCEMSSWQSVHILWGLFGSDGLLTDSLLLLVMKPGKMEWPVNLELDGTACEHSQKWHFYPLSPQFAYKTHFVIVRIMKTCTDI